MNSLEALKILKNSYHTKRDTELLSVIEDELGVLEMKNYYVSYLFRNGAEVTTIMNGNTEHEVLLKAMDMLGKASVNSQLLILNNIALDTHEVVAIEVREDFSCETIEES